MGGWAQPRRRACATGQRLRRAGAQTDPPHAVEGGHSGDDLRREEGHRPTGSRESEGDREEQGIREQGEPDRNLGADLDAVRGHPAKRGVVFYRIATNQRDMSRRVYWTGTRASPIPSSFSPTGSTRAARTSRRSSSAAGAATMPPTRPPPPRLVAAGYPFRRAGQCEPPSARAVPPRPRRRCSSSSSVPRTGRPSRVDRCSRCGDGS